MTNPSDRKIARIDTLYMLGVKTPQHISQTVRVTKRPSGGGNTYKAEWVPAREALWIAPSVLEAFRIRAVLPATNGNARNMQIVARECIRKMQEYMPWLQEGTWRQTLITRDGDVMQWTHTRDAQNGLDIKGV